ncbi:hypothetical protein D3C78_790090 [compost metagenome]
MLQLIARHRLRAVSNTQHLSNAHRRLRVITSDHLHANPGLLTGVDSVDGLRARRVHHAGDPKEYQPAAQVIVAQRLLPFWRRFKGGSDHAQALTRIALHLRFPVRTVKRLGTAAGLLLVAQAENHIRCAGDQNLLFTADLVVRAHVLVLRVKRDFANQRGDNRCEIRFRRQHFQCAFGRPAGDAPQTALILHHLAVVAEIDGAQIVLQHRSLLDLHRLVATLEADIAHRLVAIAFDAITAVGGDNRFNGHFVHGQRAGFIRADHGHRAQRFDGRQLADNGFFARHRLHAEGQNNGDNRRQAFRNGRHSEANQGQQQLAKRNITQQHAEDKQRGHHHQNQRENRFAELVHLHQQRRAVLFDPRHHLVNVAKLSVLPGGNHDADTATCAHGRTGEHQVGAIAQR